MSSQTPENPRGHARRALFKAGAGTAAASAVIVGLGTEAQAAQAPAAPATIDRATLSATDPHAHTHRQRDRSRGRGPHADNGKAEIGVRILPIDRAVFRAGARFDLRIEVTGVNPVNARVAIDIQDKRRSPAAVLSSEAERSSNAGDELIVEYKQLTYPEAGEYTVKVNVQSRGEEVEAEVVHEVRGVGDGGAKNVILFIGDGMDQAPITGARILSKGLTEGKYHGLLEMDRMDYRGLVTTSGADALATDSANSASAYNTGHKSSVNAMGVYESSAEDDDAHPNVETLAEIVKRTRNMGVGVVTTAEVQDATPASVWAHTRRRSEYLAIMDQALDESRTPDVLLGGGLASLLPSGEAGSGREDDRDLRVEFEDLGFAYAQNGAELTEALKAEPQKLLGMFHTGNLNVYLDRAHQPDPEVLGEWDDQPGLVAMTEAALSVLERREEGFYLMVEAASIDKMSHPMDGPRVIYDTIEFDQAIGAAKAWAEGRDDTLIVITADHAHSMSIIGTRERDDSGRDGNGVYADAAFPTYTDSTGDGFPDDPQPEVGLFFGWSNHPDHTDDFLHNERFGQPALSDENGNAVPNPDRDPDAELQIGNLPTSQTNCVHTVQDVPVMASGPGSAAFNGVLDNTEVFHKIADALGVDATE